MIMTSKATKHNRTVAFKFKHTSLCPRPLDIEHFTQIFMFEPKKQLWSRISQSSNGDGRAYTAKFILTFKPVFKKKKKCWPENVKLRWIRDKVLRKEKKDISQQCMKWTWSLLSTALPLDVKRTWRGAGRSEVQLSGREDVMSWDADLFYSNEEDNDWRTFFQQSG